VCTVVCVALTDGIYVVAPEVAIHGTVVHTVGRRGQAREGRRHGGVFVARGAVVTLAAWAVPHNDPRRAPPELFFGPLLRHVIDG
jgi:hypothetical protein